MQVEQPKVAWNGMNLVDSRMDVQYEKGAFRICLSYDWHQCNYMYRNYMGSKHSSHNWTTNQQQSVAYFYTGRVQYFIQLECMEHNSHILLRPKAIIIFDLNAVNPRVHGHYYYRLWQSHKCYLLWKYSVMCYIVMYAQKLSGYESFSFPAVYILRGLLCWLEC